MLNLHRELVPYQPSVATPEIIDLNPSPIETIHVPAEFYVNSPLLDFFDPTNAPEVVILDEVVDHVFEEIKIERLEHAIQQIQREQMVLRDSISVEIAEATSYMNQGFQQILAYLKPIIKVHPEESRKKGGVEVAKRLRHCRFPNCGGTNHDSRNCPNKKKNIEHLPSESPNK